MAAPTAADPSPSPPTATATSSAASERRVVADLSPSHLASASARARQVLSGERQLRVLLLSSDTGGGHRASANALRAALNAAHPGRVKVDVADFWVELAQGTFRGFPDHYAFLAKHPWLWKLSYEATRFPPLRSLTEFSFNFLAHRNIRAAFTRYAPDLIISVHPLVNTLSIRVLDRLRRETSVPSPPFVTVVTDLGGAHPTWFNPRTDMVYVPNRAVAAVASDCRVASTRIRTIGLPVRKPFWAAPEKSRDELREELGMHKDMTAFLLIGGGDGVGNLGPVAKSVAAKIARDHGPEGAQLVVICGKNKDLLESLQRHTWRVSVVLKGYVNNISDWMAACDALATKAGPGTIAEGLIRGMPILLTGFLPGQEEANVKYVVGAGAGEYSCRPAKIAAIASRWVGDPNALTVMSAIALGLATPASTQEIASDIWEVARAKIACNTALLDKRERIKAAQVALAQSHLLNPSALRAAAAVVGVDPVSGDNSHLLWRVKILMRIVFGSKIAVDAVTHTRSPLAISN
jgi:1,2-diacylglycerol 3-beta-galactosyltransferase